MKATLSFQKKIANITLVIAFFLAALLPTELRAEVITVGSGTSTTYYAPVNNWYNYTYTQILYTSDELQAGTISSIGFQYAYSTATTSKTNVTIYMGTTSTTSFSSVSSYITSGLTQVYSGNLNCSSGWNTFDLQTPYNYSGTGSLLVVIVDNSGDYDGSSYTFYATSVSNKVITYYADSYSPNGTSPNTSMSSSLLSVRPNTQFTITPSGGGGNNEEGVVSWGSDSDYTGTTSYSYSPYGRHYGWEYKVYCYPPGALPFSGDITSMAFLAATTYSTAGTNTSSSYNGDSNPMQIWMKEVDANYQLSSSTTFATYVSGATKVYSGINPATTSGQYTTFDMSSSPFTHSESNGLLVLVRTVANSTSGCSAHECYYKTYSGGGTLAWAKKQDSNDPGVSVSASSTWSTGELPVLKLTYSGGATAECDDFENVSGASSDYSTAGSLPSGWDRIFAGTVNSSDAYAPHVQNGGTPGTVSSGYYIGFYSSGSTSEYSYAIMPAIDGAVNHLSFRYKFESSGQGTLTYGVINRTDENSYTILGTISSPSSNPGTVDVDLDPEQTAGKRIAFRWYKTSTWYTCGIDDVCVTYVALPPVIECNVIGTGTATPPNTTLINQAWGCTYSQHIYTADELSAMGLVAGSDITSVAFNFASTSTSYPKTQSIYIGNTTQSEFTSASTSNYVSLSNLTQVYGPTYNTLSTTGWKQYTFTQPFAWDGTSNIVVAFLSNSSHTSSSGWGAYSTSTSSVYRSMFNYKDSSPIDVNSLSSANGPVLNYDRPNIKFCYELPDCDETYTVSATANESSYGSVSGGGDFTACETATLTATPGDCYRFVNWTDENDNVVSTNPTYSFRPQADRNIVANFQEWNFTLSTSPSTISCIEPGTSVTISVASTTAPTTPTYSWNNGATGSSITVTPTAASTTYKVTATVGGCTKTKNKKPTVSPQLTSVTSDVVGLLCLGSDAHLSATSAVSTATLEWSNGDSGANITVTPSNTTTYTVTASTANCSATGSVAVDVLTNIVPGSIADAEICSADHGYTLVSETPAVGCGTVEYQWHIGSIVTPRSTNPEYTLTAADIATLGVGTHTMYRTFYDGGGHTSNTASATLTINPPMADPVVAGNRSVMCGYNTTLSASSEIEGANLIYRWYSDPEAQTLVYEGPEFRTPALTENTTYYLQVTDEYLVESVTNFPYTGGVQTYTIPSNTESLKLEVWGAQGGGNQVDGNTSGGVGGKGGYSVGTLENLAGLNSISVYVGGQGQTSNSQSEVAAPGGWNGGGTAFASSSSDPACGGGGATDIRINGTTLYDRIIVAGGGGGEDGELGGAGGGTTGVTGSSSSYTGGTQTSGGSGAVFGIGASTQYDGGAGGGGWYGGGCGGGTQTIPTSNSSSDSQGGCGGSGFVWTAATASNAPTGYNVPVSFYLADAQTIAGNATMPNPNSGTMTGREGNGYARITAHQYVRNNCPSAMLPVEVTVTPMPAPVVEVRSACIGEPSELVVTNPVAGVNYQWSTNGEFTDDDIVYTGTTFTPTVNDATTYYVRSVTMGAGVPVDFDYTGSEQTYTVPAGVSQVQLEVWGAQGGDASVDGSYFAAGGAGGYSSGIYSVSGATTLYVVVGGQGTSSTSMTSPGTLSGGYNGGGYSMGGDGGYSANGSGGGATHIATASGLLSSATPSSVLLVAGGGGGAGTSSNSSYTQYGTGGYGGGLTGGSGVSDYSSYAPCGPGSQTAGGSNCSSSTRSQAGSFGQGGNQTGNSDGWGGGAGGGGWYGGGSGGALGASGGGGSGYIGGVSNGTTIAGDLSITEPDGTVAIGHSGNGFARITALGLDEGTCPSAVATVTLTPVEAPNFNVTASSMSSCNQSPVTLTVVTSSDNITSYEWSDGTITENNTHEVTPGITTSYTVLVSNGTCAVESQPITIIVDAPEVSISGTDNGACVEAGEEIELTCSGGGINGEVTIGSGTLTTYYFPIDNYFHYSCTEQIFLPNEIGGAGTITSISMQYGYSSSFTADNVTMYMKNVSRSTFSSTTDYEPLSASDIVWTGTLSPSGAGWVTLNLTQPFDYDGTSNLLVAFYDGTSGYPGTSYVFNATTSPNSANMALAYKSDSDNPDPYNLGSYSGSKTLYTYRVNTKFNIVSTNSYAWSNGATTPTITVTPDETTTYTVTVSSGDYGCPAVMDYTVRVKGNLEISAEPSTLCAATDESVITATGAETYVWNNGSRDNTLTANGVGTYSVTGIDANGCTLTGEYALTRPTFSAGSISSEQVTLCQSANEFTTIASAEDGTSGGGITYRWLCDGNPLNNSNAASYTIEPYEVHHLSAGTHTYTRQLWNACDDEPDWVTAEGSFTLTVTEAFYNPFATVRGAETPVVCGTDRKLYVTNSDPEIVNYWYSDSLCTQLYATGDTVSIPALFEDMTLWHVAQPAAAVYGLQEVSHQDFQYTGGPQTYTVPSGATSLKLEVWGAEGGGRRVSGISDNGLGGLGGYSVGTMPVLGNESIQVYVGGIGGYSTTSLAYGGYNGGGTTYGSSDGEPAGGGGGGTDIRLNGNTLYHRIIVAGGGGGGGEDSGDQGGYGGGTSGGPGNSYSYQGTQTSSGTGGVFGSGASSPNDGGAGGGGWYGGGTNGGSQTIPTTNSGTDCGGGSGGSGYVWTSATASSVPSGYSVPTSYYLTDAQTIAGNTSFPAPTGGSETGHQGNGYARITAYEYVIVGYEPLGCASIPQAYTLQVTNQPVPEVEDAETYCGVPVTLRVEDPNPQLDYVWSTSADFNENSIVGNGPEITITEPTGNYTYYVRSYKNTFVINHIEDTEEHNLYYTGDVQTVNIPEGAVSAYLQVWGAQGGTYSSYTGGLGGYSEGTLNNLDGISSFKVYVGGAGTTSTAAGYNGGGAGVINGRGGGGATDIRVNGNTLYDRIIVAGGGGGAGVTYGSVYPAGCGGGEYGGDGYYNYTDGTSVTTNYRSGSGATQTQGGTCWTNGGSYTPSTPTTGSFGQGGNASNYSCGGGGGGWYGGGGAFDNDSDADGRYGGGGSGYVWTAATASSAPTGYNVPASYYLTDAQTIAGNTSFPAPAGGTEIGHQGNGYARITINIFLEEVTDQILNHCESATKEVKVTVNAAPEITYTPTAAVCGDYVTVELDNTLEDYHYDWYETPNSQYPLNVRSTTEYESDSYLTEGLSLVVRSYPESEEPLEACITNTQVTVTLGSIVDPVVSVEGYQKGNDFYCGTPVEITVTNNEGDMENFDYAWFYDEDCTQPYNGGAPSSSLIVSGLQNRDDRTVYVKAFRLIDDESTYTANAPCQSNAISRSITVTPIDQEIVTYNYTNEEPKIDICENGEVTLTVELGYENSERLADAVNDEVVEQKILWYRIAADENEEEFVALLNYDEDLTVTEEEQGTYYYRAYAAAHATEEGTGNVATQEESYIPTSDQSNPRTDIAFGITTSVDLTINTVKVYPSEQETRARIYYNASANANPQNADGWRLAGEFNIRKNGNDPVAMTLTEGIDMEANTYYTLFITADKPLYMQKYGDNESPARANSNDDNNVTLRDCRYWNRPSTCEADAQIPVCEGATMIDHNNEARSEFIGSIDYTVRGGVYCMTENYAEDTIVVHHPSTTPNISVVGRRYYVCHGDEPVTLQASAEEVGDDIQYMWYKDGELIRTTTSDTIVEAVPVDESINEVVYSVSIYSPSCGETDNASLTLHVSVAPTISNISDTIVCAPGDITEIHPDGEGGQIERTWWESSVDGETWEIIPDPSHLLTSYNGLYIRFAAEASCVTGHSNAAILTVDSAAYFDELAAPEPICENTHFDWEANTATAHYVNNSGREIRTGWNLFYGRGDQVSITPETIGEFNEEFTFTYQSVEGYYAYNCFIVTPCGDSVVSNTVNITVWSAPVVDNLTISDEPVCAGGAIPYTVPSYEIFGDTLAYGWEMGDFPGAQHFTRLSDNVEIMDGDIILDYSMNNKVIRYYVVSTCGTAYSNAVTLSITDRPHLATLGELAPVCDGTPFTLAAPAITDEGGLAITDKGWYLLAPNADPQQVTANDPMTQEWNGAGLCYFATNGCGTTYSDTATVTVHRALNLNAYVSLDADTRLEEGTGCFGPDYYLVATSDIMDSITYRWSNQEEGGVVALTRPESGDYTYTVTAAVGNGCSATAEVTFNVLPVITEEVSVSVCYGDLPYTHGDSVFNAGGDYEIPYTTASGCDSIVTLHLTVHKSTVQHTNAHICNGQSYEWPVNGTIYGAGMADTVLTDTVYIAAATWISDITGEPCDSVIHTLRLEIRDGMYLEVPNDDFTAAVGETVNAVANIRMACDPSGAKTVLSYQLFKDGEPVGDVNQYGTLNLSTYLPRLNTSFGNNVEAGDGDIPGNTFNVYNYDYNYFYASFFNEVENHVTATWDEAGEYELRLVVNEMTAGQDFAMTYRVNNVPSIMGGSGATATGNTLTETVSIFFHVEGEAEPVVEEEPMVTYIGSIDIDTVAFNETVGETSSFTVTINGDAANETSKLALDYEILHDGEVVASTATYGNVHFQTLVPRLNRWYGDDLAEGTGSIPDNTFTVVYYEFDYFYNHFMESTDQRFTALWNQPGDYTVKFYLRQRTDGQDIQLPYSDDRALLIGGHGSGNGPLVATAEVSFHIVGQPVEITLDETLCENDLPFVYNGIEFNESTDAPVLIPDVNGIYDTLLTVNLTVNPVPATVEITKMVCDSYVWNDEEFTESGDYTRHFENANGCDSTVILHLTVIGQPTVRISGYETVCAGAEIPVSATVTYQAGVDNATVVSFTADETSRDTSTTGTVTVVYRNSLTLTENTVLTVMSENVIDDMNACGVADTFAITVLPGDSIVTFTASVCQGTAFDRDGDWDEVFSFGISGERTNAVIADDNRVPTVLNDTIVTGENSCGIYRAALILTVNPVFSANNPLVVEADVCENHDYADNYGFSLSASEIRERMVDNTVTVQRQAESSAGCDSVTELRLTVIPSLVENVDLTVCGSYYDPQQNEITESGYYEFVFENGAASGCDSVVKLNLTVNQPSTGDTTATACESFDWYEHTGLTQSGDYTHVFTEGNSVGCDSVVTLHLTVNHGTFNSLTETACGTYTWEHPVLTVVTNQPQQQLSDINDLQVEDNTYDAGGDYIYTYVNGDGCPSADTLHLTVNPVYNDTVRETVSVASLPYLWNGLSVTSTDTVTVRLETVEGCDSVMTLVLTVEGLEGDEPFFTANTLGDGDTVILTAFANQTDGAKKVSVNYTLTKDGQAINDVRLECGGELYIGTQWLDNLYGASLAEPAGNVPQNTFHVSNYHYDYLYFAFLDGRANTVTHSFTEPGEYKVLFELVEETGGQDFLIPYDDNTDHRIGGKNSTPLDGVLASIEVTFTVEEGGTQGDDDTPATSNPTLSLTQNGSEVSDVTDLSTPVRMTVDANGYAGNDQVSVRYTVLDENDQPLSMLSSVGTVTMKTAWNGNLNGGSLPAATGTYPGNLFRPVSNSRYNFFYLDYLTFDETYTEITANWTVPGTYKIQLELVKMTNGQDFAFSFGNNQHIGGKNAVDGGVTFDTKTLTYGSNQAANPAISGIADNDSEQGIVLYPNPTRSTVFVKLSANAHDGDELQLFDLYGKRLRTIAVSGDVTEIDLGTYAGGMYIVKLVSNGEVTAVAKVVKQR